MIGAGVRLSLVIASANDSMAKASVFIASSSIRPTHSTSSVHAFWVALAIFSLCSMVSIVSVNFERCLNAALQILREPPSSVLSVYHSVDPFGSV